MPRVYHRFVPIEFDNQSPRRQSEKPSAVSGPSISFSQEKALSNSGKTSTISWVLILILILPIAGILIGVSQIQEAKHSASRGEPWSAGHVQGLYFATALSVILTLGFGLLLL